MTDIKIINVTQIPFKKSFDAGVIKGRQDGKIEAIKDEIKFLKRLSDLICINDYECALLDFNIDERIEQLETDK